MFDRLLIIMLALIPGQAVFIHFADVRPSTSYVIGVVIGVLASRLMYEASKRDRSF